MTQPLNDWTPPDDFPAPTKTGGYTVGGVQTVGAEMSSTDRLLIVLTASAEFQNPLRNREGIGNCNYYSGWWGNSGVASSSCKKIDGVTWRQNAWCADFARYVWARAGGRVSGMDPWAGSFYRATVGTARWKAKDSGYVPQPGDAVLYDWDGLNGGTNGWGIDHVGIVVTYVPSTRMLQTYEGNTTASGNGGTEGVYARNRATTWVVGYVTPQ
jgi:hypothetical protein